MGQAPLGSIDHTRPSAARDQHASVGARATRTELQIGNEGALCALCWSEPAKGIVPRHCVA